MACVSLDRDPRAGFGPYLWTDGLLPCLRLGFKTIRFSDLKPSISHFTSPDLQRGVHMKLARVQLTASDSATEREEISPSF